MLTLKGEIRNVTKNWTLKSIEISLIPSFFDCMIHYTFSKSLNDKTVNHTRLYMSFINFILFVHVYTAIMRWMRIQMMYSLNKKEWICSLFKEWILEKSEFRVNLEWIWSEHLCYSLILEWPQGSLGIPGSLRIPEWSLWSLQNE